MDERLTAGHLDEARTDFIDARNDVLEIHPLAAMKCILRIAPCAAQRTACQSNERTRQPRPGALALNGMEDLRHTEKITAAIHRVVHCLLLYRNRRGDSRSTELTRKSTFAGRSASRRIRYGYHAPPKGT